MELSDCSSHARGESVIFEKGLGDVYAEAREVVLTTGIPLAVGRSENNLRAIREYLLRELAGRGWEINQRIFPPSAPGMFQRGQYRLDATKRTGSGGALGFICHFGSSEFLVRKFMLISEAVRRGIVVCGILALMTRDTRPYVTGRPACYEQAHRLLRVYGQSGFCGIPMILWGLIPEGMRPERTHIRAGMQVGSL
jgi:hypothetical protein